MTLYELNQAGYTSLPKMTSAEIETAINQDKDFFNQATYFMLLCKELSDYTVFHINNPENGWNEVLELIKDRGTLKAIENKEDSIEFWITNDSISNMFLLFPYDWGVIDVD